MIDIISPFPVMVSLLVAALMTLHYFPAPKPARIKRRAHRKGKH